MKNPSSKSLSSAIKNKRPVYINLLEFKFPLIAIISVLHRISGLFLCLFLPLFLYFLSYSLSTAEHFTILSGFFSYFFSKLLLILSFSTLFFHALAGFKHLLMDFGKLETLRSARSAAYIVIALTLIFAALLVYLLLL